MDKSNLRVVDIRPDERTYEIAMFIKHYRLKKDGEYPSLDMIAPYMQLSKGTVRKEMDHALNQNKISYNDWYFVVNPSKVA